MSRRVVVIGAGPAGAAAALAAARSGADVVVVDGAARPGGQYHRLPAPGLAGRASAGALHLERALLTAPRVTVLCRAAVWAVEPVAEEPVAVEPVEGRAAHRVHVLQGPADGIGRTARTLDADALVLCPGAYDRALPFPGWELPGVYTAGAAQALAKGQGLAVGRRAVVCGTGPFLLPVAAALAGVGAEVVGVFEAGSPLGWLRSPLSVLRDGRDKLPEAAGHAVLLARHRIPYRTRTAVVAAHGTDRVEAVTVARLDARWRIRPGSERRVEGVDAVCTGFGFTPQLELAVAAGCALGEGPDGGPRVTVDGRQATSVPGVYAAGEITGVGGARLAAAEGELAGLAAAGGLSRDGRAPAVAARVRSGRRFAAALAAAHPVRDGWHGWLADDTLVCRCEEVPYADLRAAVAERGVDGLRALKLSCRVGLGACQGRVCLRNAAELAAVADPEAGERRPIAQPVRLGDLAREPDGPDDPGAPDRPDGPDAPAGPDDHDEPARPAVPTRDPSEGTR
ncbi:FAD-dependent oxidoreductase [Streptomyces sp. URMC 123]|uniref:FAD/NAD(P)-dependent oxidoreductase n=1 Tax=Streptomyces sp. URMC 123 TaxID=3423403 RepID=UPI003F1CF33D